jgi:hypothetical protein
MTTSAERKHFKYGLKTEGDRRVLWISSDSELTARLGEKSSVAAKLGFTTMYDNRLCGDVDWQRWSRV